MDAAIRAAKVGLLTAEDQLRLARQGAAKDVSSSFYDVLLAKELNSVARQTLDQKVRHLDEAKKRYAAGVATDYDVLAAEVEVKNAQPEILRTENLIRLARDRLRYLLAVDDHEVDALGTLDVAVAPVPGYAEAFATAGKKRPELSDLRHRIGAQDELVIIQRASNKPRVDFKANYGARYLEIGGGDAWGPEWTAGIFATWNLFDGLRTDGKVAQAASQAASLRIDERKLLDAVALEVRDAGNNLKLAEETLRALEGTVSQAQRLLSMAEKGFEYGVKTKLDVDDAQLNLNLAKVNVARARRDCLVARVTLRWAMGVLGEEG